MEQVEKQDKKEEITGWEAMKILGRSKVFWLINILNFGDGIAYFGMFTLMTRFMGTRIGMADTLTGISVSTYSGLVTLFMFGGGFITDKLGVRRAFTWSLVIMGVGRVLLSMAPYFTAGNWLVYGSAWTGLFLMALGSGIFQPTLYAGVKEYTDSRTATFGYALLYSIMNVGILASGFFSPFIRTDSTFLDIGFAKVVGLGLGIDGVFWACVIVTAIMIIAHWALFTKKVDMEERIGSPVEEKAGAPALTIKDRIMELPFLDKRFMFFIFVLLPVRTLFAHQFLTIPDYVFRCFPKEVSDKFEWINGLNPFIIVIFVPLIAVLTRKVKIIDMMIIGTTLTAVTTFILVPGPNLSFLLTYVIIFALGEACWSSRFLEYVADIAPAGKVGAYMGLAGLPWFFAKFTTGLYSGSMLEIFIPEGGLHSSGTLWMIYAIIACISPVALIIGRKWLLSQGTAPRS